MYQSIIMYCIEFRLSIMIVIFLLLLNNKLFVFKIFDICIAVVSRASVLTFLSEHSVLLSQKSWNCLEVIVL